MATHNQNDGENAELANLSKSATISVSFNKTGTATGPQRFEAVENFRAQLLIVYKPPTAIGIPTQPKFSPSASDPQTAVMTVSYDPSLTALTFLQSTANLAAGKVDWYGASKLIIVS
ncbi:uncharacterized protein FTJAE_13373 [Fusarium tjaetaba]|uniref:Uncharacterized protein n=1 Tax=Fusarium tjaetaba TaxID=1567544 RepID=A0A8H5QIX7_9HYPO|nr:uncharacterized protein FTJAE_13373 [Fusarium tjaetaba]KAF5615388.1 hypothetical protein FTJAE_13373 [Fusarium tjaetaba]